MNAMRTFQQAQVKRNLVRAAATQPPTKPADPGAAPVAGADVLTADQVVEAIRTLARRMDATEQTVQTFDSRLAAIEQALTELRGVRPPVRPAAQAPAKRIRLVMPKPVVPPQRAPHKTRIRIGE